MSDAGAGTESAIRSPPALASTSTACGTDGRVLVRTGART